MVKVNPMLKPAHMVADIDYGSARQAFKVWYQACRMVARQNVFTTSQCIGTHAALNVQFTVKMTLCEHDGLTRITSASGILQPLARATYAAMQLESQGATGKEFRRANLKSLRTLRRCFPVVDNLRGPDLRADLNWPAPSKVYRFTAVSCPSQHWNDGSDYCSDCGFDLQWTEESTVEIPSLFPGTKLNINRPLNSELKDGPAIRAVLTDYDHIPEPTTPEHAAAVDAILNSPARPKIVVARVDDLKSQPASQANVFLRLAKIESERDAALGITDDAISLAIKLKPCRAVLTDYDRMPLEHVRISIGVHEDIESPTGEIARILRKIADEFERDGLCQTGLYDSTGRFVGDVEILRQGE